MGQGLFCHAFLTEQGLFLIILCKYFQLLTPSCELWQGSNSKIEHYVLLAAVTLFERYYSHFWHVDTISHCADNGSVF